jgi:prophage regulatory protein
MQELENAIRDQVSRELARLLNVTKFGEQIIAERLDDAVLKLSAVSSITALPPSTLYRKVQRGEFPAPVKLGQSASGWLLSEVVAWIAARRAERDREQAKTAVWSGPEQSLTGEGRQTVR